ncbi:ABC transporter permease [Cellulosilyticum sp. I15G10I2]|uniref:ABC transporter permease n=1 Tax=Cellulosilyticum sp. I15G10I2 TaxID=1892843 RepID=UPI001FA79C5F|nr:ABC transporter permease subunit [Cellulosilyticum sp. I15G10I2]
MFKRFMVLLPNTLSLHLLGSLLRILTAVTLSLLLGVPLGLLTGTSKKADAVISPIIYILYPLPKIAFLPIFMILFGIGDASKIILIVTIIIFQILLAVRDGVKEIPQELFYSVSSLGVSPLGMYQHLILPAVVPRLISGLRISIGISISALFFAENFATTYGIGYYIMNAWTMVDYLDMFCGILALSLLGFFLLSTLDALEKGLCPWLFAKSA